MKLRNKETGEVVEADHISVARSGFDVKDKDGNTIAKDIRTLPLCYLSVRELTSEFEDFEDYTPKEPLIKDEKVRKAVRAWAEAVDADSAFVEKWTCEGNRFILSDGLAEIHFRINTPKEIKQYKRYTIAELCGEGEE